MKIYLTEEIAELILESEEDEIEVSLDLGKTKAKVKRKILLKMPLEKVRGDFVYLYDGKTLFKIAIAARHYYKLRMYNGFPILEIDGLRMQLVKHFANPLEYSKIVVQKLGVQDGDAVLDTCMGLGYTATAAAEKGAHVKTIELDENVLEIAKANPWSFGLFENRNVETIRGNAAERVKEFPNESFDKIMHDPPRFSLAGELYSLEFYNELFRVAKKGAKLFHYTGTLGMGKGKKIYLGVMGRLKKAGWAEMKYDARLQGIFAAK